MFIPVWTDMPGKQFQQICTSLTFATKCGNFSSQPESKVHTWAKDGPETTTTEPPWSKSRSRACGQKHVWSCLQHGRVQPKMNKYLQNIYTIYLSTYPSIFAVWITSFHVSIVIQLFHIWLYRMSTFMFSPLWVFNFPSGTMEILLGSVFADKQK